MMTSALLVEVVDPKQHSRAVSFSFVQGFLKARGVVTKWLRFASPLATSGLPLPPAAVEGVERFLKRAVPPTHVLLSHEPASDLWATLRHAAPEARIGWVCDQAPPASSASQARPVFPDVPSVAAFFDLPAGEGGVNLFEEVAPEFAFEPANPEAASAPPLPFLVCGPRDSYRPDLASNPCFQGLDLSGCDVRGGCTFHIRPVRDVPWMRPVEEVMARQLDAVVRAWRRARERLLVRATGEYFLEQVETFAALVVSRPLPACDFLLDGRSDLLLGCEAHIAEACRTLQPTPHRLHISPVGVENFSDTELLRMNKGTTGLKNLDLARLLLRLEREYPTTFAFRRWGGLSLILFTPWTRPQDLAFNLSLVETGRIERFAGKVFSGRLRLHPGLPLHRLAGRDGLIVPAYDDPRLDTTPSNPDASLYPDETPWRFQDPRMESVCRVLARIGAPPVAGDPVDEALDRAFQRLGEKSYGIGFALGVVDAAIAADRPLVFSDLIEEATRLRRRDDHEWTRLPPSVKGRRMDPRGAVRCAAAAARTGLKPVVRLDGEVAEQPIPGAAGLVVLTRTLGQCPVAFVSRDASLAEQAAAEALREGEAALQGDASACVAAILAQGRLLGYPECCVQAFASAGGPIREEYLWLHILRRVEADGEVSPLFHPAYPPLVEYVPCSLSCRASLDRATMMLEIWRAQECEAATQDLLGPMKRPWLFLTEGDGNRVELVPEGEPGERFRYRPGQWAGDHPLVRAILDGDEVVLDDTGVAILQGGRLRAALGCRAFLWWHRRVFHRDLWRGLIALRFDPRHEPGGDETTEAAAPEDSATLDKARRLAAFVAGALTSEANDFEGFRIASIEPWSGLSVRLSLRSPRDRMTLLVEPWNPSGAAFQRVGPLAVVHPDGEPLDTPAKVRAARRVASRLKAAIARRTPRR